jgi:hypothetical protein
MKLWSKRLLAVLLMAAPVYATEASPPDSREASGERDAVNVRPIPAPSQVRELQESVERLQQQLAELRAQEEKRFLGVGDPDSHPLWP